MTQAFPGLGRTITWSDGVPQPASPETGMTLRQWYAGRALSAIKISSPFPEDIARIAFGIADAMIAQDLRR